jgi:hypothetical protein
MWTAVRVGQVAMVKMNSQRHNRLGLFLALLLAVMFAVGAPAHVLIAADRCVPAADHASPAVCMMTGQSGPCCCDSAVSLETPAGAAIGNPDECDCSLQAPPPTLPAATEGSARGSSSLGVTAALPTPVSAPRLSASLWTLSIRDTGPPQSTSVPSIRPRAPPAC